MVLVVVLHAVGAAPTGACALGDGLPGTLGGRGCGCVFEFGRWLVGPQVPGVLRAFAAVEVPPEAGARGARLLTPVAHEEEDGGGARSNAPTPAAFAAERHLLALEEVDPGHVAHLLCVLEGGLAVPAVVLALPRVKTAHTARAYGAVVHVKALGLAGAPGRHLVAALGLAAVI